MVFNRTIEMESAKIEVHFEVEVNGHTIRSLDDIKDNPDSLEAFPMMVYIKGSKKNIIDSIPPKWNDQIPDKLLNLLAEERSNAS